MNKYAITKDGVWVEDIHADDEAEALSLAKAQHGENVNVECVAKDDDDQRR